MLVQLSLTHHPRDPLNHRRHILQLQAELDLTPIHRGSLQVSRQKDPILKPVIITPKILMNQVLPAAGRI